ncbi:MAG: hypothetical protein P8X96_03010 [Desulfobacteraceae bacterium]|jgi:hypothetical protein
MRIAAIMANLIQMIIVLAIFLWQGLTLGGLTILALFILLIIASFNLLVLLFPDSMERGVIVDDKKTIIKRQDLRVSYVAGAQPALNIGNQRYEVLDIAESGIRILIGRHERLKKRAKCHIELLCGEVLNIRTLLVRRNGDEAALAFKPPIEYRILLKEKQAAAGP